MRRRTNADALERAAVQVRDAKLAAARERLRRYTRCKRLRVASLGESSGSLHAMLAPVARYCVELLDSADEAMQTPARLGRVPACTYGDEGR